MTLKQALECRFSLLNGTSGRERRGAFGLFTLPDLQATLDAEISRLTEDHAALSRLIGHHSPGQLIAESGFSNAELSRLITTATPLVRPTDTEVCTPEDGK